MRKEKLTDRGLKALKPTDKPYDVMDIQDETPRGFGVRVMGTSQAPVRTFILFTRFPGSKNPTRRAIGQYGELSLAEAREKARAWRKLIAKGIDPRAEQEREKQTQLQKQENSFRAVAEEYIKRHVVELSRPAVVEREIRQDLIARWKDRPITDITQHDVVAAVRAVKDRDAPYSAHTIYGHASALFNWALAQGIYGLDRSPCDRLKRTAIIGKKLKRKRTLTDAELRAFWNATETMGYPFGALFRILLLTGLRRSEAAEAPWSELDLNRKLWTIPAQRMKSDAPHVVPLTSAILDILNALPRHPWGPYLFSTTGGKSPVRGFSKAKKRLDSLMITALAQEADGAAVALDDWVVHDLRRTTRTHLSGLPVAETVRELILAHARPGLHAVYDQYAYLEEKCTALELWAARLRTILDPAPDTAGGNVIRLAAGG
jgi:integrase